MERSGGLGDRNVFGPFFSEHDSTGGVEIGRGDQQLALRLAEVFEPRSSNRRTQVPFGSVGRVQGRGQILRPAHRTHRSAGRERVPDVTTERSENAERPPDHRARKPRRSGCMISSAPDARDRCGFVTEVGEDQLLGSDPVRETRSDDRARRRSDVDVEVVDPGAATHRVHRVEHAQVVGGAGDTAAAKDQSDPPGPTVLRSLNGCDGFGPRLTLG